MRITHGNIATIARECELQRSGEMSVAWMLQAYDLIQKVGEIDITVERILCLGWMVEPMFNVNGWRPLPVLIGGRQVGVPADSIDRAVTQLVNAYGEGLLSPEEFYQEFETIHPFAEGNGRVGFLLYNIERIVKGETLVMPPMYRQS